MSFRHAAIAYLIGLRPENGKIDVVIAPDQPTREEEISGKKWVVMCIGAHNYDTARELLMRELQRRYDMQWVFECRSMRLASARAKIKARQCGIG